MTDAEKDTVLRSISDWRSLRMTPRKGEEPREIKKRWRGGETKLFAASQVRPIAKRRKPVAEDLEVNALTVAAACWTINKTAKRYREAGKKHYEAGLHGLAANSKLEKELCYSDKDLAVAWLAHFGHLQPEAIHGGLCLWTGVGYSFHSTLTAENVPVTPGDVPITIEAKPRGRKEMRLIDARRLLSKLEDYTEKFKRLSLPIQPREERVTICYECGEAGHISHECPNRQINHDEQCAAYGYERITP